MSPRAEILDFNDLASDMLELAAPARVEYIGRQLSRVRALADWLSDHDDEETVFRARVELRRSNGVPVTLELAARRSLESRQILCLLSQLSEDRLMGEAQLYFDSAFETAPIGMALFNTDGEYIRVNQSLCEMLGRTRVELLGRRDQEFTHPDDRPADVAAAWRILNGERDTWQCEKRFLRPDGTEIWTIANLTFLRSADGHPLSWVGQFQDISERKTQEGELRRLADRDPLTGLANRRCLEERLTAVLAAGEEGAVLFADLDGFKEINDSFGHRAGDQVLTAVAGVLRESLRSDDIIARIGGDEFACILRGAGSRETDELAGVIQDAIGGLRFDLGPAVSVSVSVGTALFEQHRRSGPGEILAHADAAMYRAKRGRSHGDLIPASRPSRRGGWFETSRSHARV